MPSATLSPPAPVAVFAYNRPTHLARALASLAANPEAGQTSVTVYCDAARRPEDRGIVAEVRQVAESATGFGSLETVFRESNLGLARSVISGVGVILKRHGRVIVVEDDLLLSPHFLRFMNEGLARYADEPRVGSIHGYCYPVASPLPATFFLRGADCWGWATWSRAWAHFEPDGSALLAQLRARRLTHSFDLDGHFPFTRMLEDQILARNNSWAIRWRAACFLKGMLTLYPGRTLVDNIGNDSSGTHCGTSMAYSAAVSLVPVPVDTIPIEESAAAAAAFGRFLGRQVGFRLRAAGAIRRVLGFV